MAKQVQLRRGTTSEHSTFTGAVGEVTVDTTKDTLVVHDGSTTGGIPLAKQSSVDLKAPIASPVFTGDLKAARLLAYGSGDVNTNVAVGADALRDNTTGFYNVAVGNKAMLCNTTADQNVAVGDVSLCSNTTGRFNSAVGRASLYANITGSYNSGVGAVALRFKQDGSANTDLSNCTGLGYNTKVSDSNQVQLGDSSTTTYVYGTVQNRSDIRDKTDITTTVLGLDFINKIRPVDFRWDMRDDYFETIEETKVRIVDGVEETYTETKLVPVEKDGSKKRNRKHHGVIAQEVKAVMDEMNIDFAGYQDHTVNGGTDVLTIGYDEFIAPLIKAVQELSVRVKELEAK